MADISGLIVGGIGSVAGILALVYAHIANNNAKRSITVAGESRDLAVEANDLSRQSNTIATGAREIAQDANDISRRSEARETERHDVRWEEQWVSKQNGFYAIVKRGNDVAYHVKATATLDKGEHVVEADTVTEDGTQLRFRFGSEVYDRDKAALDEALRARSFSVPLRMHAVDVRIEWTTALGTPKLFTAVFPVQIVKLPGR
ncbi:hypothetical protein [Mycolicibacterium sp. lyk4-40-TYG-92]|uniref:hypothetical protein n=1 Tax=Mycolicibacterium sp. lyk4-40-TYG-92 TaxID=3040295 RepID=UPI00254BC105|nr:hypothetical protein [Mycolicibacterium sp. lyk4-40-TYG-92]